LLDSKLKSICDIWARQIKLLEAKLERDKTEADRLSSEISKLEQVKPPNSALIAALKKTLKELERKLPTDEVQLVGFKEDFDANCG
jgi:chromosome segregation ATPase